MKITEYHAYKKKKKRKFRIILLICLSLAAAAAVLVEACKLEDVAVTGNTRYTKEEIEDMLVTEPTDYVTFLFWLRGRLQGFGSIPFIEKLEVGMADRHSATVTVYEKLVTGCVEQMGSYLYFDRDGVVVESSRIRLEDIPVITGLKFNKIVLKEKMEVQREELFEVILNLVRLIDKQELHVTEIRFGTDYEVTLYIGGYEVLLGRRENYDEVMAVLKSVMESWEGRRLRIDMSGYENGNGRITAQPLEDFEEE